MVDDLHVIIEYSYSATALAAICEDIGELRDLVPEWSGMECDEICERIGARVDELLKASR